MYIRGHTVTLQCTQTAGTNEKEREDTPTPPPRTMFIGLCSPQPCTQPQDSTVFVSKHTTSMKFCQTDEKYDTLRNISRDLKLGGYRKMLGGL